MSFDVSTIAMVVFCTMMLGFVIAFAVHFYKEGNRDAEFLERVMRQSRDQKAKLRTTRKSR